MDRERVADGEQCAGRDSPRVRRDLLFPRVIVEFTQLRFTSCSRWNRLGLASFHLGQTARELGLDLFSATLILGSILVDLGELELHAVDDAVPTFCRIRALRRAVALEAIRKLYPCLPSRHPSRPPLPNLSTMR